MRPAKTPGRRGGDAATERGAGRAPKGAAGRTSERAAERAAAGPKQGAASEDHWELRLYVAGQSPKSLRAFANLKRICDQHMAGKYSIEVIDLLKNPQLAAGDQIVAVPTLVRKLPEPMRRIIGDLSNEERALVGLDLRAGP